MRQIYGYVSILIPLISSFPSSSSFFFVYIILRRNEHDRFDSLRPVTKCTCQYQRNYDIFLNSSHIQCVHRDISSNYEYTPDTISTSHIYTRIRIYDVRRRVQFTKGRVKSFWSLTWNYNDRTHICFFLAPCNLYENYFFFFNKILTKFLGDFKDQYFFRACSFTI